MSTSDCAVCGAAGGRRIHPDLPPICHLPACAETARQRAAKTWAVRVPGATLRVLADRAELALETTHQGDPEFELAERVSLARIRPRGRGFQAWIRVASSEQIHTLAEWARGGGIAAREVAGIHAAGHQLEQLEDALRDA